jgi:archaemetzincin
MRIGILRVGKVDENVLERVRERLGVAFPETTCEVIAKFLNIPEEAFDRRRKQYRSDIILNVVSRQAKREKVFDRVLGIVNVDLFVPRLNFVFGEAECSGKAALISLWRLRPKFYGKPPNMELLVRRSVKEAIHEIGHTLGLNHCPNPFCVMYFSDSIFETDRKQGLFCNKCFLKVENTIRKLGLTC